VIENLVPDGVHFAETLLDLPDVRLFPQEEEIIARAVEKRRLEFTSVRGCARKALAAIGVQPVPLLPDERGAPQWPDGVVGSMTHCAGFRAAAVAHRSQILSIGIDAEPNQPVPEGVLTAVAGPAEVDEVLGLLRSRPAVRWDRLLFSAKESVYKSWYPLAKTFLEFDAAVVTFAGTDAGSPLSGSFQAQLQVPGPWPTGRTLSGRWIVEGGLLCTAIVLREPAVT
jgi:enterobactin synthetase component D / holo-[acyl-carrier protein] synthase